MSGQRRLEIFPWLVWIIVPLIILCVSLRALTIHDFVVEAGFFGAHVVVHYGFAWDIICFQGGNNRIGEWHCRPGWPYEAYLVILIILLIIALATWCALRKKWIKPLPIELNWNT